MQVGMLLRISPLPLDFYQKIRKDFRHERKHRPTRPLTASPERSSSRWTPPFPITEDLSVRVANAYGMIQPGASDTSAVRVAFTVDDKG